MWKLIEYNLPLTCVYWVSRISRKITKKARQPSRPEKIVQIMAIISQKDRTSHSYF